MVLENGVIPPNTNFEKVNPKIDARFLRIKVSILVERRLLGPSSTVPGSQLILDHIVPSESTAMAHTGP